MRGVPRLQVRSILLLQKLVKTGDHDFFSFFPKQTKIPLFFFLKILFIFLFSLFFFKNLSHFSSQTSVFSLFFSFSLSAKPSETPRIFLQAFSSPPTKSPPKISQKPYFFPFLPKCLLLLFFFPFPTLAFAPPYFLSRSDLEILTFSLGTLTHLTPHFPR